MKAIVYTKYGSPDVLELKEIEKPVPNDNEVLVKVRAAAVNAFDWHMLRADPFFIRFMAGFSKPKKQILGADIAGKVEAVGKNVTLFQPGDEVFGGIAGSRCGGFAEFTCAPESLLAHKPDNVTLDDAAAVYGDHRIRTGVDDGGNSLFALSNLLTGGEQFRLNSL